MDLVVGSASLWLLLMAGAAGVVAGWLLPRLVLRHSPDGAAMPSRPVLAATTAALFALAAVVFGLSWQLPAHLFLAAVAVMLTVIDLRHHLLPNSVVWPALSLGFLLLAVAAAGEGAWGALLRALLGAFALFGLYLVLALISPAGLGMGDVKLAAVLGLFLGYQGWGSLLVGALLASVIGAVVGLAVLALGRGDRRSDVPFGPSMLAGALVGVLWGERLARESLLPGLY